MNRQYLPRAACWILASLAAGAVDIGFYFTAVSLAVVGVLIITGVIFRTKGTE